MPHAQASPQLALGLGISYSLSAKEEKRHVVLATPQPYYAAEFMRRFTLENSWMKNVRGLKTTCTLLA